MEACFPTRQVPGGEGPFHSETAEDDLVTTSPLQAPICPLCGMPNECAASATGSFAVECWCKDVMFTESLLAAVAPEHRGQACICRRCAQATAGHRTAPGAEG
ncbi:MAG: cysteine-rich CWC family protein [Rubrivivax sp.]